MMIKILKSLMTTAPKNKYKVQLEYMEGDADGYHHSELLFDDKDLDKIKQYLIYCEVLKLQYPQGRGGDDNYDELPFFHELFNDDWHYSYDGEFQDTFEGYVVTHFDETGQEYSVGITLTDEDKEEIKSYGVLNC